MPERVQQGTPLTLSQQWYEDGVAADPGTVTVGITRADGTVVVAAGTSTSGSGTSPRTSNLTTTHTALLDMLKVTWTSPTKGALVTYVEVVGGFLFTLAQAKAVMPTTAAADLADARTYAETELEGALGYALVPRYTRETITGSLRLGTYTRVRWPNIRAVRDVIINGVALTAGELADLTFDQHFIVGWSLMTTAAWRNEVLVVGYEHGLDTPPPGASRAALALATEYLGGGTGTVDPRAERLITDDGTLVFGASSAGAFRAPGVNEWVSQNRSPLAA